MAEGLGITTIIRPKYIVQPKKRFGSSRALIAQLVKCQGHFNDLKCHEFNPPHYQKVKFELNRF